MGELSLLSAAWFLIWRRGVSTRLLRCFEWHQSRRNTLWVPGVWLSLVCADIGDVPLYRDYRAASPMSDWLLCNHVIGSYDPPTLPLWSTSGLWSTYWSPLRYSNTGTVSQHFFSDALLQDMGFSSSWKWFTLEEITGMGKMFWLINCPTLACSIQWEQRRVQQNVTKQNFEILHPFLCFLAPKPVYSQGVTSYTQSQQTRQVTVIKPAAPSPASSTFSIYPVTSTVQPVAAAASVVPSYSQSPTYSTNAVTYSGKLWHFISKTLFQEQLFYCSLWVTWRWIVMQPISFVLDNKWVYVFIFSRMRAAIAMVNNMSNIIWY